MKVYKTDARWKYGVCGWGSIAQTCEHIIGSEAGVIRCRGISPLSGQERFDTEFAEVRCSIRMSATSRVTMVNVATVGSHDLHKEGSSRHRTYACHTNKMDTKL